MKKKRIYKWPKILPKALYNFSYEPKESFARTPMESGAAKHRVMKEGSDFDINVEWKIPRENQDDFLFFIHKIIGEDCGWGFFELPLIMGNEEKYYRVRFVDGNNPYKINNRGNKRWHVTARLEIIGFDFMSDVDFFERNPDVFEVVIDPLDKVVNEEMPEYFKDE